jgi:hypothetical protein
LPGIDAVCSAEHGELTAKGVDHVENKRLAEVGLGSGVLLPGRLAAALRAISMHTIPSYTQKKFQNPCYQIGYCTEFISTGEILVVYFCLQQHVLPSQ